MNTIIIIVLILLCVKPAAVAPYDNSDDFPLAPPQPWDITANHSRQLAFTTTEGTWYIPPSLLSFSTFHLSLSLSVSIFISKVSIFSIFFVI